MAIKICLIFSLSYTEKNLEHFVPGQQKNFLCHNFFVAYNRSPFFFFLTAGVFAYFTTFQNFRAFYCELFLACTL